MHGALEHVVAEVVIGEDLIVAALRCGITLASVQPVPLPDLFLRLV